MTRSKKFAVNIVTSYLAIGTNVLYTLASVPLALHYLSNEEFGLWALVTQMAGYFVLIEFGMSGAIARSLSDHKDEVENGNYGSILRTGAVVFSIQGLLVFLLSLASGWLLGEWMNLADHLQRHFVLLLAGQGLISGLRLALGSIASPLWCHQRLDVSNLAGILGLVLSLALQWLGFHLGWHLYSLLLGGTAALFASTAVTWHFCRHHGFYPPKAHRGRFDRDWFRRLFRFGSGLFVMNLGIQLASASQVIVAGRVLGMEASATWAICTKIYSLGQQFIARILDSAAGGLTELHVRGESSRLRARFAEIVMASGIAAAFIGSGIALLNAPFVEIWSSGKIRWSHTNDLLLGLLLFTTAITRCHIGLVGITKRIRGMKYACLLEGLVFVGLSIPMAVMLGLTGILLAAIASNLAITGLYGLRRTAACFSMPTGRAAAWNRKAFRVLLLAILMSWLTQSLPAELSGILVTTSLSAACFVLLVIPLLWFHGMSLPMRARAGDLWVGVRKRLFPGPA